MKEYTGRRKKNQDGSVLLAVLTIMTFASILAATAMTFVRTASDRSFDNINEKQSYYTASTCLETFIDSVLTPDSTNLNTFINIANSGGGTCEPIDLDGMGTCTISIEKPVGVEYIKVISTAVVNGKEDSVVCYLRPSTEPSETNIKNAVELTGDSSAEYNNLNVIGGMAGSNDSRKIYSTSNDTSVSGTFFQYGSIAVLNHIHLSSGVRGEGVSMTTSRNFYCLANEVDLKTDVAKKNDNKSNFIFANGAFVQTATAVSVGTASSTMNDGVRPNDVDVFAHGIVISLKDPSYSSTEFSKIIGAELLQDSKDDPNMDGTGYFRDMARYTQYGNIYCLSGGETNSADGACDAKLAGNLVLDQKVNKMTVYGDVYVEGDLYMGDQTQFDIIGNLYVNGSIVGNTSGLNVKSEESSDLAVGARRTEGTTGFIYCTNFMNSDACKNSVKFSAQTKELETTTFAGLSIGRSQTPSNTYEGTKFLFDAEDLLISPDTNISTISDKYIAVCKDKGETYYGLEQYKTTDANKNVGGIDFDYIITGSCYLGEKTKIWWPVVKDGYGLKQNAKILIDVTSTDIVVVLPNELQMNNVTILVRNTTKDLENDKTNKPSFCYFAVDTYTDSAKVEVQYKTDPDTGAFILDKKGNKVVEGSTHEGFNTDFTLTMDNVVIADYDTYTNTTIGTGSKALNITDNEITNSEVYNLKNGLGYNVMLLTEGTKIQCNNQCFFEATIYGRQASVSFNNGKSLKVATGVSSAPTIESHEVSVLGSAVVGGLKNGNNLFIVYYPPSSKSNLANLGSDSAGNVVGYEVLKYTKVLT